jgi:metallo-beta-lactamase family protein
MRITFLGGVETVTGSKYLLEHSNRRYLVDCGLFQGQKELRLRNWNPLPIDSHSIDAVILTHAHIDHSGYLPLLVKNGFKGRIYCSFATQDLCSILLPDSGYLQEEEAFLANKFKYSKHHPALPLYTKQDAINCLEYFSPLNYGIDYGLDDECFFRFNRAGHILGASIVTIHNNRKTIVFTGDLGRASDPLLYPPAIIQSADYLVVESTYGNRIHEKTDPVDELEAIINKTVKRGGSIIIPSFAVGRAQNILYYLYQLKKSARIPNIPIFVDSPMATSATKLLLDYPSEHRLSKHQSIEVCAIAKYINTPEESQAIDDYKFPMIIISASGMATGGRVLHHLKLFLPDARNTILFTGFQAKGTRGDRLTRGETEIKIHGQMIPVKAEIIQLRNTSAHADSEEMLKWLSNFNHQPHHVFITHGEKEAGQALQDKIIERFQWKCSIPKYLDYQDI